MYQKGGNDLFDPKSFFDSPDPGPVKFFNLSAPAAKISKPEPGPPVPLAPKTKKTEVITIPEIQAPKKGPAVAGEVSVVHYSQQFPRLKTPLSCTSHNSVLFLCPSNEKYGGTPDFVVPENEFDEEGDKIFEDTDCHSKSNVWAIAYIILLLMERTTHRLRPPATDYVEYNMECWDMLAVEFLGYTKDLIRTVESCLAPTMEERPSSQEISETIEGYLDKYSDGMKRWGTLSWATDLHNKLQAEAHPSSTTSSSSDEGGTPIPAPPKSSKGLKTSKTSPPSKLSNHPKSTIPSKRKSDAPLPPSKRPKDQDSRLDRRLTNLAYQILYGAQVKTYTEPFLSHPSFILKPATRRIKYSTKHFPPIIRPELFFYAPEPEVKEHRIEPRGFVDWLHGMGREERELVIEDKWWKKLFEEGEVIEGEPVRKRKPGTGVLPFRTAKDNGGDDKEGGGMML